MKKQLLILSILFALFMAPVALPAQVTDTTGMQHIMERIQERGTVRIMITYRMDDYTAERGLNEGQRLHQRQNIHEMHDRFEQELRRTRLNIHWGRRMEISPRVSMTVDREALIYLYNSELVERIELIRGGTIHL